MNYELRAVGEGRDAQGEVSVRITVEERTFSGRAVGGDIVEASVRAYLSAMNKFLSVTPDVKPPQVERTTVAPRLATQSQEGAA